ncbi:BRISC and BRCA1-A complex member 2-like [Diabrotica undecimpunctata]|uniref:BRISC and BRCA1-A complex member 2-like n=1 Tax=Diabrotica undecimpunctata TaxID=50387 RepID=UPI003B633328
MSEILNNTDNILSIFPACLRKNIEELCLRSTVGFLPINLNDITINQVRNNVEENAFNNYHFILKVPYAGKRLRWEVIFDPEDFYFAPDFIFNDEEFLNYPDVDTLSEVVPSWTNWNLKNPKALAQILNEFLTLYKKHQIEKLHLDNIYSRYSEEFKILTKGTEGISPEDIEVSVDGNTLHFLICLKVDCSSLPEYVQPIIYKGSNLLDHMLYNQGEDFAHLVTISKLDGSRSTHSIHLSPRLEQVLGGFRFNTTDFKKDSSLSDVVSLVSKTLDTRLQQVADHFKLKKIFITNLAAACFRSIIEYDVLTYNKAVFIYNLDDYNCLVTVTIGQKYPVEKPAVVLSSVYCPESKACSNTLTKYPYNPTLKPEANVEHLIEFLHDAVLDFKNHRH